ncbi:MAG: NUDIX domain-containing protein [Chloroflexota bacterium]|nr:NUDIX domain-containing protein [Chloroflexota bacterium]
MFLAPVAVHLLLVRDSKILMLRRYNTGYQDGNYSVVAGHIDGGEELKTAMIREAREEAGIDISPADLTVVGVIHLMEDDEYVSFFLHASRYSGDVVNREPDKCDDLTWFDLDDLPPNTIPYVRRAIQNYRNGIWFDSLGWH